MRNVRQDYPDMTQAQVERIRDLMNAHVRDCLVTGYEPLIPRLTFPTRRSARLAATIRAGADVIVTANLADFPTAELSKYGIEAQHPTSSSCTYWTWPHRSSAPPPNVSGRV